MEVKDNFLDEVHLIKLDKLINSPHFPWFLQKEQVPGANDGCFLRHLIYESDEPTSNFYAPIAVIFKSYLKYVSLCRMTANLLLKQENPSKSNFHVDIEKSKQITTAIFYLNTNNGATEFKDGNRIDCVRNRLVMFPTTTPHRAIGQTDVNERIVLNFNFTL